jgi:hypothetical protein
MLNPGTPEYEAGVLTTTFDDIIVCEEVQYTGNGG